MHPKPKSIYNQSGRVGDTVSGEVLRAQGLVAHHDLPPVNPTVQMRLVQALDCLDRLETQACQTRQALFGDRPELAPVQDRPMSIDDMLAMAVCRLENLVNDACGIACRLS